MLQEEMEIQVIGEKKRIQANWHNFITILLCPRLDAIFRFSNLRLLTPPSFYVENNQNATYLI